MLIYGTVFTIINKKKPAQQLYYLNYDSKHKSDQSNEASMDINLKKLDILYEDDELLIVNKPSGLLTIPDRYRKDIPNLLDQLKQSRPNLFVVHRLDKGTSGLICFAKNENAHKLMNDLFESRQIDKYYVALVKGVPSHQKGLIDAGLSPLAKGGMKVDMKRGKPSVTEYEVLETFGRYTFLQAKILTGRMHQIRVHMKYIGHPLLVDELYASNTEFYLSEVKRKKFNLKKDTVERPILTRVPLHAQRLKFIHPITAEQLEISCPLPKDIQAVLNQFRKWIKD